MRSLSTFMVVALAASAAGCGSSSPTTPTSTIGYTLLGQIPAAVNGAPETRSHTFLLSAQAAVSITLTSASEALLDGTTSTTVSLGLALGTMSNGACAPIDGAAVTTASGTSAQLTWTLPAGADCVQVSDVTIQEGPVNYAISLTY